MLLVSAPGHEQHSAKVSSSSDLYLLEVSKAEDGLGSLRSEAWVARRAAAAEHSRLELASALSGVLLWATR